MKKLIPILFCSALLYSCKQKPTYNPFDDQFSLDRKELLKNGMDTIIESCGYYHLAFKEKKFSPFYQFHFDDENEILSKGFSYIIDTIFSKTTNIDSIKKLDYSLIDINKRLQKFNKKLKKEKNKLRINQIDTIKRFGLEKSVYWESDSTFIRNIYFYIIKQP
jgi:hypothetical protein